MIIVHQQLVMIKPDAWLDSDDPQDIKARGQLGRLIDCMDDNFPIDETTYSELWMCELKDGSLQAVLPEELIFIS